MAVLRAIPATAEAIEGQERARRWRAYQEATRASNVYGNQGLPTPEQHAGTMEALFAGAKAASEEFGLLNGFTQSADE